MFDLLDMGEAHFSASRMYVLYTQYKIECSQPDVKGSPNLTSTAACNMWTMPHKTQVVGIDMQHPFNRNIRLLPSDLSIFHSPGVKWHKRHPKFHVLSLGFGFGYRLWLKIFAVPFLPLDPSPADKSALLAPEMKAFAGS